MINFVLLAVGPRGNIHHWVHNPSRQLLHEMNLVIIPNPDGTLRVWKECGNDPRNVTPDEVLALMEKWSSWGEKLNSEGYNLTMDLTKEEMVERYNNLLEKLQSFPPDWARTREQDDRVDGICEMIDHLERLIAGS